MDVPSNKSYYEVLLNRLKVSVCITRPLCILFCSCLYGLVWSFQITFADTKLTGISVIVASTFLQPEPTFTRTKHSARKIWTHFCSASKLWQVRFKGHNDKGSISPNLRTAFKPEATKSIKIQSSCQYLFMLMGSTGTKAARRTLMKLTQGRIKESINDNPLSLYIKFFDIGLGRDRQRDM